MKTPIYPCLWFNGNAKEAAEFYTSVFKDSRITTDTPVVVNFELGGQKFMGLNGGPQFKPNPSISFFVVCGSEVETDEIWQKLVEGGQVLMTLDKYDWSEKYGWVQDRFGINWQLSYGKLSDVGQNFTPVLMFTQNVAGKAEEAINFYSSLFPDASTMGILRYSAQDHDQEGLVKHAQFTLGGNVFMAMDSTLDHAFKFNEGISLVVECKDQQEIDHYWNAMTQNGEESMCGWLKDPYGVSWQIVPSVIGELMSEPEKAPGVMNALMGMKKLNIDELVQAYEHG
jgi:predicted 3-demethylubiquinone-9 3-methyltransferase (glyoxalase superfamily)